MKFKLIRKRAAGWIGSALVTAQMLLLFSTEPQVQSQANNYIVCRTEQGILAYEISYFLIILPWNMVGTENNNLLNLLKPD